MQYGMGYVEFLSLKKEIEVMLSAGYRFSAIYRKLVSGKKITMSYTTFSRYVSGRYLKKEDKKGDTEPDSDKSATAVPSATLSQAPPPATAEQKSHSVRSGPKILGRKKSTSFGGDVIDLADLFGTKTE